MGPVRRKVNTQEGDERAERARQAMMNRGKKVSNTQD